ncbi:hypothetical protein BB559_000762 [Furculomyces boomerangus]|uniref:Exportin-T n=2 Tax=Harpellales TaxID=61421 RepID=A0A2T9Z444_9FUNG|nr:hypothetical protein BB559_000762 [Furculomyces boomerangus]
MDQIEEAVRCALDPNSTPAIREKATEFFNQIKDSADGWRSCLALFVRNPPSSPETRLFCLQVIENVMEKNTENLTDSDILSIKQELFQYVSLQCTSEKYKSHPQFLINKLSHCISLLFLNTFPTKWPSFFHEILGLTGIPYRNTIEIPPNANRNNLFKEKYSTTNPYFSDFTMKILMSIDEEMVNPVVPRDKAQNQRNTLVKDAMREEGVILLAQWWYNVLLFEEIGESLVEQALSLISVYISWIDIKLVVNEKFIPIVFSYLYHNTLCTAVVKCLSSIVRKGMPFIEKLSLIEFLNLGGVLSQIKLNDIELAEEVAKLVNVIGIELKSIWVEGSANSPQESIKAYKLLENLLPMALGFLSNESMSVSSSVFTMISETLTLLKKQQKSGVQLSPQQTLFLGELLQVSVKKLQYNQDFELGENSKLGCINTELAYDDDDEEAILLNTRHQLRQFLDAILSLVPNEYESYILSAIKETYTRIQQYGLVQSSEKAATNENQVTWIQAELAIHLTQVYIEQCSSRGGIIVAKQIDSDPNVKVSRNAIQMSAENKSQATLTKVGEVGLLMVASGVVNSRNPIVSYFFFETVVRISQLFEYRPEAIPMVLGPFLDTRGIHHKHKYVRTRIWYFLYRFIKLSSLDHISPYAIEIIRGIVPLLPIEVSVPMSAIQAGSINTNGYGLLDSQLYLFETCGIVLSSNKIPDSEKMTCISQVLEPLFTGVQSLIAQPISKFISQPIALLQIHHCLVAIGGVAQGFPDAKSTQDTSNIPKQVNPHLSPMILDALTKAADLSIIVLEALNNYSFIREAVRFTFTRLLSVLGQGALVYLPRLIGSLVSLSEVEELSDLLVFMGLIMYKFKPSIAQIVSDLLLPVIEKVYSVLNSGPVGGTDEAVLLNGLKRAYLTWFGVIFNADLDSIFLTPANSPHLSTIFQTILMLAVDNNNPQNQKLAFAFIHRAIIGWLVDTHAQHSLGSASLMSMGNPGPQNKPQAGIKTREGVNTISSREPKLQVNQTILPNNGNKTIRQLAADCVGVNYDSPEIMQIRSNFMTFVQQSILPICFQVPASAQFNMSDAQSSQTITEICGVLRGIGLSGQKDAINILSKKLRSGPIVQISPKEDTDIQLEKAIPQNAVLNYIMTEFLPGIGCNPNSSMRFTKALAGLDCRQFKRFFQEFISQANGTR